MTKILIKLFIKDYENTENSAVRIKYGNMASVVGIICNVLLCIAKMIIGLLFNSVSIAADAVNNLSDAANSVISYIGFVMSGKPADKDHPYGHARYEYLACLLVSFVIIMLGLSLLKTSVIKIINPEPININMISIVILVAAILTKLWMSLFYRKIGNKINSNVLIANSVDSLNDVISTSVVLITTIIALYTNINLDGFAGCLVSVLIIYSGIGILRGTIDDLIGTTPEPELINSIISKLKTYEGVEGVHDLVVHSYGPSNYFATVHVEVSSREDILISHEKIDAIERDFSKDMGINLVIHIDPIVTDDDETNQARELISNIVKNINSNLSIHDFRISKKENNTNVIFDVLVPGDFKQKDEEIINQIQNEVKKYNADYNTVITIDKNYV